MQRASRGDADPIGTDRLAVGEKNGDADVRHRVGGVEEARGFVRDQSRIGKRALRRNISFGDGPMLATDDFHCRFPVMCAPLGPAETTSKIPFGSMMGTFFFNTR